MEKEALMARIELKSGRWVEYRSDLMAEDQWAVQESFAATIASDGSRTMPGGVTSIMRRALLAKIITGWGGSGLEGIPVPAQNIGGAAVIGTHLSLADYNELAAEVQPLMDEVVPTPPAAPAAAAKESEPTTPSSS
jgi:hypothetical protein